MHDVAAVVAVADVAIPGAVSILLRRFLLLLLLWLFLMLLLLWLLLLWYLLIVLLFEQRLEPCQGSGLSQSATQRCRRSPQGSCSLRVGCRTCEEDSVKDKEGVLVLGVIKRGATHGFGARHEQCAP